MAKQYIMNHTGDTEHDYMLDDKSAVAEAMERFNQLVSEGYTAATRSAPGESPKVTRTFDPTATETLFFPRLQGG
jgi:hypothetical protein